MNTDFLSEVFRAHRALYDSHRRVAGLYAGDELTPRNAALEVQDDLLRLETITEVLCARYTRLPVYRAREQWWSKEQ